MVLYKRKQVTFVRPPSIPVDLNTEIYIIPQTKEWFMEYEDYLTRMDYYYRRKFVCEITGNSCLTFFEAYNSENKEIKDVEKNFPEALREHILRFLQFNRITRLDQLVDKVYLVFKNDYFPGEVVFVKKAVFASTTNLLGQEPDGAPSYVSTLKQKGIIREKVQYSNSADTKYLVSTVAEGKQIIATNQQISRDRNHFTKWLIKTFVKLTVTRSHKVGAPWVVKEKYAKKYRIPQTYPEAVKHFESSTPSGEILYEDDPALQSTPDPGSETPEPSKGKKQRGPSLKKKAALKAAAAAAAAGSIEAIIDDDGQAKGSKNDPRFALHHLPEAVLKELEANDQATLSSFQPSKKTIVDDLKLNFDLQNSKPTPKELELPENAKELNSSSIEALEREIDDDEAELQNTDSEAEKKSKLEAEISSIKTNIDTLKSDKLNSVQEALECWAFFNIYHSVLKLDTFTFDDFIIAMSWNAEQYNKLGRCELLDEIWCAALSGLVSNELPGKKYDPETDEVFGLRVNLPHEVSLITDQQKGQDDDMNDERGSDSENENKTLKSEDEASDNESMTGTPSPKKNGVKVKRESGSADENDDSKEDVDMSEGEVEEEKDVEHHAHSVINYRGVKWDDKLRKRNFKDGNWQVILLGALSMVEYVTEFKPIIDRVYKTLAPKLISPATPSTVLTEFYDSMGIDLRLSALHILTSLLVNGKLVRDYIGESLEASTTMRRTRLDTIRDLKSAVDAANKIHTSIHEAIQDSTSDGSTQKKRTRLNTKGYEMNENEKALAEKDPEFQNLWAERDEAIEKVKELREAKKSVETKLTEMDCQRVRLLGKDRFYNRYWWFENNGLPNLHFVREEEDDEEADTEANDLEDEKEEVQDETYLMGKLWVQGPTGMDVLVNLKLDEERSKQIISDLKSGPLEIKTEEAHEEPSEEQEAGDGGANNKTMDFRTLPKAFVAEAQKYDVQFGADTITINNSVEIIDNLGGIPKDVEVSELLVMQRKFIEEAPEPLISGSQWRYFDQTEDIERLVKWLNPWGKRESQLRKEMIRVKEAMITSIAARRKALWLDKLPKVETDIETHIDAVNSKIEELKSNNTISTEGEESDDDVTLRKRPHRRTANNSNKRQKTTEETINTGTLEDLGVLQNQLKNDLSTKIADNQINRVLEWVNSTAQAEFDRSIYDGGDKIRTKGRKPKK